jgi:hypothetical protein
MNQRPTTLQEVGDKESTHPYMQDVEGGGKGGLVVIGHVYCTAGAGVTVTILLVRFIATELVVNGLLDVISCYN